MIEVVSISPRTAYPLILDVHYAHRLPPISYAFGAYEQSELIGIVTYGIPASRPLCVGVCGPENANIVLELNRLICLKRKNLASMLVGRSLRQIPTPRIIVSYADTGVGHIGYVYQATNWLYTGLSAYRTDTYTPDGKHPRHPGADKSVRQLRSRKHRYVYILGNKLQRAELLSRLRYPICEYPKGDTHRYIADYNITTQLRLI